ncbi:MAG TPA: hypothetical protein VNV44_14035 [Solirubrobacteraceae bacterium]|nr:hypothetical protein [Solirubrobacteraceae bacterium]
MRRLPTRTTARAALLALALLAVALLAACGSSSKPSAGTTAATASTKASSTSSSAPARAGSGFAAVRVCLEKQGVKLPQQSGAGVHLPAGVSRSQFEAALKKCGAGQVHLFGTGAKGYSAAFKKALENFAACMRQNGANIPPPNTSGKGPIFDTSGLDVNSPRFRAARQKCASQLRVAKPGAAVSQ